jgi:hypothetical protein
MNKYHYLLIQNGSCIRKEWVHELNWIQSWTWIKSPVIHNWKEWSPSSKDLRGVKALTSGKTLGGDKNSLLLPSSCGLKLNA